MSLLSCLDPNKPFALYAQCKVSYSGRAKSSAESGTRLIMSKSDGSLIIHRGVKISPLNYNGFKSSIKFVGNTIISTSPGKEIIIVEVEELIWQHQILNWSNDGIKLIGTESDMREYLITNIRDIMEIEPKRIIRELPTKAGPVDLYIEDLDGQVHCIELKRKRASVSAIRQLQSYMNYLDKPIGYIVAPGMSTNAIERVAFVKEDIRFVPLRPDVVYE